MAEEPTGGVEKIQMGQGGQRIVQAIQDITGSQQIDVKGFAIERDKSNVIPGKVIHGRDERRRARVAYASVRRGRLHGLRVHLDRAFELGAVLEAYGWADIQPTATPGGVIDDLEGTIAQPVVPGATTSKYATVLGPRELSFGTDGALALRRPRLR